MTNSNNLDNSIFILDNNFYLPIYPEIFLIIAVLVFITFLVILDFIFKYKFILSSIVSKLTIYVLFLTLLLLLNNLHFSFFIFDSLLVSNYFTNIIKIILIISVICCIIISINYIKIEKIVQYEYMLLLLLSLLGMFTIVSSNDLITMYLAIELQSLSFYVMAALKTFSNFSTEAALKYFILGAFSSGMLLFGCSLIYGFTGVTNFYDLSILFSGIFSSNNDVSWGILLGILFTSVGIMFKLGAAPFHMWLPDVYEGVSTIVTAFFSIVPKIAMLSLFIRLGSEFFFSSFFFWKQLLLYSAILSLIIGTLGALYQTKLKRLLAYSAIGHIGFLLIGLSSLNVDGLFSLLFYIVVYIIISINIFSIILVLRKRNNNLKLKKINEVVLLVKSNPVLAFVLCFIMFSIAGIPPLIGFYSKFYIFVAAIKSNIYLIALVAAVISVIGSMYYIRLIKLMFFKQFNYWGFFYEIGKFESLVISSTFLINILFFISPNLFVIWLYNIIFYLFI